MIRSASTIVQRLLHGAISLGVLLALAGCGGDDDRRDRQEAGQVLTDSINAAHAGDEEKACALYTRAYVRETLKENRGLRLTGSTCEELVRALEPVLKQLTPDPNPRVTGVEVAGDRATGRMQIDTHFGPAATKFTMTREDGDWKINHDEDVPDETPSPSR